MLMEFISTYFRVILLLALLPAIVLMVIIYRQDKIEREPFGLLFKLFLFGALSTIPASLLERISISFLSVVYPNEYSILYDFIMYFAIVALAEEVCKYLFLRTSWRHPAFNYRFDAVVYGAAVSLGFAAFENLLYVFQMGIGVAPIRAVTAVPLHAICGIYMGHYYGMAKACERYGMVSHKRMYHILSLLVPIVIHGFYDFAATSQYEILQLLFFGFVIGLDITAIISVRKYARQDAPL